MYYTPGLGKVLYLYLSFTTNPKLQVILLSPSHTNEQRLGDNLTCQRSQSYEARGLDLHQGLCDPEADLQQTAVRI